MKRVFQMLIKIIVYTFIAFAAMVIVSSIYQKAQGSKLPMTFGWGNAMVLTGSMEPAIPVRSMVFIHETDEISKGDVITYIREGSTWPITHRVQFIHENTIITQGDANNAPDEPVNKKDVIGKAVLIIRPHVYPMILGSAAAIIIGYNILALIEKRKNRKEVKSWE